MHKRLEGVQQFCFSKTIQLPPRVSLDPSVKHSVYHYLLGVISGHQLKRQQAWSPFQVICLSWHFKNWAHPCQLCTLHQCQPWTTSLRSGTAAWEAESTVNMQLCWCSWHPGNNKSGELDSGFALKMQQLQLEIMEKKKKNERGVSQAGKFHLFGKTFYK